MIRNLLALIGFLAVAMAGAVGVYATRWGSVADRPDRIAVSTRGLDLTSPEGRRLLYLRVDDAIDRVCDDSARYEEDDCRRKARLGADRQIARAIDRAFDRQGDYDDAREGYVPGAYGPEPRFAPPPPVEYRVPEHRAPDYRSPRYQAPPVRYVQPITPDMRAGDGTRSRTVRERHVTITRTPLKPRVKWVKTKRGVVKKVVHRKLVRKTVRTVYTR